MQNINLSRKTLYILFISIIIACNDTPTEPIVTEGSRDYTWRIDTLGSTDDNFRRLWGDSPNNIWAISSHSVAPNTILHFNGKEWVAVGPYRDFLPAAIWGFSKNEVWIGGVLSDIWKYDGIQWEKDKIFTHTPSRIVFNGMWGNEETIFSFGAYADEIGKYNNPIITYLKNSNWEILNTDGITGIIANLYLDNYYNLFVRSIKWGDPPVFDTTQIYYYQNDKFIRLYSSLYTLDKTANISLIDNEIYFALGDRIAVREKNEFQTVFKIDKPGFYGNFWGRSGRDMFLEMTDGIAHYNGIDIEYIHLFNHNKTYISDALLFENHAFFLVYESLTRSNLLYHGKINKGG